MGTLSRPHGIRGEFLVALETDFPEWLAKRSVIHAQIEGKMLAWQLKSARWRPPKFIACVEELKDRTAVEAQRGIPLFISDEEAQELAQDPDFFYNSDLVGLTMVCATEGTVLGKVSAVHEMPAQNLLEVQRQQGQPFLFPFVAALIEDLDLEAGRLSVHMPEGLLECNDGEPTAQRGKG